MTCRTRPVPDDAAALRRILTDPRELCRRLGLDGGARPQARGVMIRCPWHEDSSPSCSVRVATDGTIAVHCFACQAGGDVLDLVAAVHGLNPRTDFRNVLKHTAELAGMVPDESVRPPTKVRQRRTMESPGWPSQPEVARLWSLCRPANEIAVVADWLRSRALDAARVYENDLARSLPSESNLPRWARFRRRPWPAHGYRCVLPMFDETGALRSVRVRRVVDLEGPKALPPTGHRAGGLIMADLLGRGLLTTGRCPHLWPEGAPLRVIIAEGEPDFLTWATAFSDSDATAPAVFGVVAGSWTLGIAARVPDGARIIIRTDHDEAGEKYAHEIHETLRDRCTVLRGGAENCALCPRYGWTKAVR